MKESTRGSAARRGRALVPLGVAAAVAIAGFVLPTAAHADNDVQGENNITVSLNVPMNVVNDGTSGWTATGHGTVRAINSSGEEQNAAPGDTFAVYTAVAGAGLTQDMVNPFPGNGRIINGLDDVSTPLFFLPSSTFGANCPLTAFCTATDLPRPNGMSDPANIVSGSATATHISSDYTSKSLPFDVTIDSRTSGTHAFTGPISITTEIVELDSTGKVVRILGGDTQTTNLTGASAPTINSVPAATVDQPYNEQLVNRGFPPVPQAFPGVGGGVPGGISYPCSYVEDSHTILSTCVAGWRVWAKQGGHLTLLTPFPKVVNGAVHWTYYLPYNFDASLPISPPTPQNGSFYLDTVTGKLYANEYEQAQANGQPTTYVIEVNNGIGGATHDDTRGGNLNAGVAPITLHDVLGTLSVPTLFSDVPITSPFYNAIFLLANDGIIEGYADGTFRPNIQVSRQAFAHFLAEYLNFAIENSPSPNMTSFPTAIGTGACNDVNHGNINISAFPDVPATSQFCAEVSGLAEAGIVNGYTDGGYHPGANISRQAMSAMLWRAHEYYLGHSLNSVQDLPCSGAPFPDVSTSNPFCGDIAWMANHNISQGYTDGGYHPAASTSRQATAQFIYNLGTYDITNFQYLKPVVG